MKKSKRINEEIQLIELQQANVSNGKMTEDQFQTVLKRFTVNQTKKKKNIEIKEQEQKQKLNILVFHYLIKI